MKTYQASGFYIGLQNWLTAIAAAALSLPWPGSAAVPAQQAYVKASNTGEGDYFGRSVAVSGDTMVVGAYLEDSSATGLNGSQNNNNAVDSGAAYIFVRNGTNWTQQAYLKASNTGAGDSFGYSVAISGNTVVVGAPYEDSSATGVNGNQNNNNSTNSGAVYVFVRNGTTWSQQAYLKASNTGAGDFFGLAVAISGDTLVVGSEDDSDATGVNGDPNNDNAPESGAAYVFVRNGSTWSQQAYLKAPQVQAGASFGGGSSPYPPSPLAGAVAVSGDTVVVGAFFENNPTCFGAAYVFVRNGTNWTQEAHLIPSSPAAFVGYSVAVSGDTALVAAPAEGSSATGVNGDPTTCCSEHSGAAFVFVRSGTNWSQQAYLKASNTDSQGMFGPGDAFGYSVAASGDTVVVSTPLESSSASGVNGDQSNNNAFYSGAAYVFVRSGTNWSQQAYLKASNTGGGDAFGCSVGVSGDTLVSGAFGESRSSSGVNGNQTACCIFGSGSAYVFAGLGSGIGPRLSLARDGGGGYFIRFNGISYLTYRLQRALSATGPWSAIATNTAPASGLLEFHDTTPLPGQAFYRTFQP